MGEKINIDEKTMKDVFDSILCSVEKESESLYGDKVNKLIDMHGEKLLDVEMFDILIGYEYDNIVELCIKRLYADKDIKQGMYKLIFLYKNYKFISYQLRELMIAKEGMACCADKTRWLVNRFKNYIVNSEVPDMTIHKKCYWKPSFGTGEEWMNFCDSLIDLYYGKPQAYLLSLNKLIKENDAI